MSAEHAREQLIELLKPRYGDGEAKAITRIVWEDAFRRGYAFDNQRFEEIRSRLLSGEPLQYVLGQADFFGLKFKVSPAVLIPRQETEELVAWVLETLRERFSGQQAALLDIGLGSGCIGITLKKQFPALQLYGLEKSPEALALAIENVKQLLGAPPRIPASPNQQIPTSPHPPIFLLGDILSPSDWHLFPVLDVVVSNPPYIPFAEKQLMPEHVLAHEPALALFVDDPDPLLFYRAIAEFSLLKLRPGGLLFLECNEFNAPEVAEMLREKGFSSVELRKDLAGADRMVRGVGFRRSPTL